MFFCNTSKFVYSVVNGVLNKQIQLPDFFGNEDAKNSEIKLSNLREGKIGAIVIKRSGKMQLQIGNKSFELNSGRSAEFVQDVVAKVEEDGQKKMGHLGRIRSQYVVTPNWEHLLKKQLLMRYHIPNDLLDNKVFLKVL